MPLPISDEEKKRIYAFSGVDPNKFDIVDSGDQYEYVLKNAPTIQPPEPATSVTDLAGANLPKPPGGLESTARAAASSVLPTAGGLLATAGVMAALPEPFVSKIGALGALGLAGVAGLAGSYGASKLQDEVVPDSVKQALFSRPEDLAAHPYLSAAGGFVPSALAFKPNLGDLKTLASGVRNLSPLVQGAEGALTQAERAALLNATANIAPAAGMEAYEVGTGQKEFDPISSALNIVPGALFTRPTALGQKLGFPNVQDAQPVQTTPEIQPTTQEPAVPKAKPATTEGVQSGFNKEGVVVTSSGEILPAGATKLNKPDLTGEIRGKNPYEAMSGNTDDTIIGEQRPIKSAAASAEVLKQAPIEAQKAVDYETAIRERAKQDAEEVYKKAYEEAAQAKLVNTDVARPEIKPKPIATTELEKEIFPDYTGVQEADASANITQPKTEAEWIQEQFDRQERYQPADDTNKQADKDTQFIKNFEQEVQRRGMKVKYVDSLVGADGKQKRGSYDPKTRTVTISKSKNLVDTYSHEVGHGYVEDLLKTGRPGDERQVLNGLEFADEKGRKFKTRAEWDALSPEEKLSIEERFVQQLGEEGAKLRKTELYGSKREKFSQWFENVGSNLKYKLGMGEGKDVSRKTAVGQKFDQPEYTQMRVDEVKAAAPKFQDIEDKRSDFQQYQDVQAKIKERIAQGDFESEDFRKLWQENENIKNRNGGMPPKEEGEKFQAVEEESTSAKPYILPSRFDKVAKLGKTGEEISSKLQQYNSESDRLQGQVGNKIIAAMKGYDENEIMRVSQYRHAKSVYEPAPFELTSNEKKLKASLDEVYKGVGEEVIKSGMKIKEGDDFREMQLKGEGYQPSVIAQKVIHAWQERTPDAPKYDKVYTDFMEKKGLTPEEAKSTLQEYKEAVGNAGLTPDVKFNAIRKAEGKGLPWELVEQNPAVAARRYGRRVGNDMAFFKYLQNDPRMLKALGLKDQQGRKAEVLAEELGTKIDDVEWLGNSEEVKSALRSVYGIDTPVNQRGNAFIRAVSNSVMETGTALRNIVGLPTSIAGYYGVTPKTVLEAIVKTPERAARAFENNAVRSSFADQDAAGVVEGSPDKFVKLMDNYSRFMRKWTGRDFSDKFEGEFTYSLGETLAHQWFASAKTGDIKARRMLNRFGNTVDDLKGKFQPKGEITATDISKVAKNFVDATRGSYSAGGLPSSAIEGGAAPMLSLARWSIEKFNTFQKDIVRPITEHNDWMPLVKTAFAGLLTGEAVENLNELLSGKRGADPTKEEVFASGSAEDYTYKVIALLQMGGFAGMLSEAAKAGMATYQGKELKFNNPVSMPALTLAETTFQNIADAVEASKQGEDKLQVMGELMKELVKTTYQNYRYVDNRLLNPEEAKRKEKFRDIRVYKELSGEPPQKSGDQNKFLGMKERAFKRANTPEEVASSLPEAAASVVKKSEGNYEKLKSGIENLKRNSYQTFPSLSENPQKAIDYYNHLVKTLGRKEADDRFADYLKQNTLNKQKNKVLPTLK